MLALKMNSQRMRTIVGPTGVLASGVAALALFTALCFRFGVNSTTVGLLFLIVIVLVSFYGRFLVAGLVAIFAYLALDYFFTPPLFQLGMNQALDYLAPVIYLILAFVIAKMTIRVRESQERERRAAETLRKARADLAHVRRIVTMGELGASIAHEINQPLTAIVNNGNAGLRWLNADEPNLFEAREAVQRIVCDGIRAGEVISRMRGLLRKTEAKKTHFDLNETIRKVVELTRTEADDNGVEIALELTPDLPEGYGDPVQFQQVVLNLCLNSMEALLARTAGKRELRIATVPQENDQLLVEVSDNGPGVAPEAVVQIFEPFYTSKPDGMGLGLAISRSIVEEHGGRLWTDGSELGAAFRFTVPRYRS